MMNAGCVPADYLLQGTNTDGILAPGRVQAV
jgi:hypothetical protein